MQDHRSSRPLTRKEWRLRFGVRIRELRGERPPEKIADDARIAHRTYREIEKGNAAVELDIVEKVALALKMPVSELVAPLLGYTVERERVDTAWAQQLIATVEREARSYGAAVHTAGMRSAIASLTVIAKHNPQEVPAIAALLGSRASDLHLSLADRIRRMQNEADRRAEVVAAQKTSKSTTRGTRR